MLVGSSAAAKGQTECMYFVREQEVTRNEPGGWEDKMGKEMEAE